MFLYLIRFRGALKREAKILPFFLPNSRETCWLVVRVIAFDCLVGTSTGGPVSGIPLLSLFGFNCLEEPRKYGKQSASSGLHLVNYIMQLKRNMNGGIGYLESTVKSIIALSPSVPPLVDTLFECLAKWFYELCCRQHRNNFVTDIFVDLSSTSDTLRYRVMTIGEGGFLEDVLNVPENQFAHYVL